MVFAGLYPIDGDDYPTLRDALDKLQLNDAALMYEPETSGALGFGFRCGFLGLLHMEIVRERLEREFNLDLISTAPNVVYRVGHGGRLGDRRRPTRASTPTGKIDRGLRADRAGHDLAPVRLHRHDHGALPEHARHAAGHGLPRPRTASRSRYTLPLAEIVFDFFDALKSRTKGYASLDYEPIGEQAADLVKVDVLLQGEPVDAFSAIVHRDKAYAYGVAMAGEAQGAHPAAAVRGADPGRDRCPGDRPRDDPRDAQGRPRQVLRR